MTNCAIGRPQTRCPRPPPGNGSASAVAQAGSPQPCGHNGLCASAPPAEPIGGCWPPRWEITASALTRLADHLDARPYPINYERRRGLDYADLPSVETLAQICRDAGQHPGTGRRLRIARCIVFTQISGTPIEHAPEFPTADHNMFRAEAERFTEV